MAHARPIIYALPGIDPSIASLHHGNRTEGRQAHMSEIVPRRLSTFHDEPGAAGSS